MPFKTASPARHLPLVAQPAYCNEYEAPRDGTVSKDEMVKCMGTEFYRVDVNQDGTLDARELAQFRVNVAGGK